MSEDCKIIKEIKKSREINDTQHKRIFDAADVSMKLAEDVNGIVANVNGFRTTVAFIGKTIAFFGVIYLIFEEPLHKAFGG